MRLSIVNAATSAGCSSSVAVDEAGLAVGVCFPNSDAKDDVRREEVPWADDGRCPGRGGSGGLGIACRGNGRVWVCEGSEYVGYACDSGDENI